jgi:DNA-binding MarR family transcriptional regulator
MLVGPRVTPERAAAAHAAADEGELLFAVKHAVSRMYSRFRSERVEGDLGEVALSVLARVEKYGPHTLTALSQYYRVTPASMSQAVNRLTGAGLAERVPDPEDGRRVRIAATRQGTAVSREARSRRNAWLQECLDGLTDEDRAVLGRAAELLTAMADS